MTPQLLYRIVRWAGQRLTRNSPPFLLEVKFRNGTYQRLDLPEQDSRLSVVELRVRSHWTIYSRSQWKPINVLLEENSLPSSAMISSVRLLRLSWSGEYEEVLLSHSRHLPMSGCVMRSTDSGGFPMRREHYRTTR